MGCGHWLPPPEAGACSYPPRGTGRGAGSSPGRRHPDNNCCSPVSRPPTAPAPAHLAPPHPTPPRRRRVRVSEVCRRFRAASEAAGPSLWADVCYTCHSPRLGQLVEWLRRRVRASGGRRVGSGGRAGGCGRVRSCTEGKRRPACLLQHHRSCRLGVHCADRPRCAAPVPAAARRAGRRPALHPCPQQRPDPRLPPGRCPKKLSLLALSINEPWGHALEAVRLAAPALQTLELNWQADLGLGEPQAAGAAQSCSTAHAHALHMHMLCSCTCGAAPGA